MIDITLPVDNVHDTIVQDCVGKCDSCVVDPGRAVRQYRECEIGALQRRHGDVTERGREDDIVGNDVVGEDFLECRDVCGLKHGANVRERFVGGDEDGVVG